MFIAFNSTFAPLFALGPDGDAAPRRHLPVASAGRSTTGSRSRPSCSGASMLVFLFNVVYSLVFVRKPAPANPWDSKSLEWQTPTPVPVENFPTAAGDRHRSLRLRRAAPAPHRGRPRRRRRDRGSDERRHPDPADRVYAETAGAARADRPDRLRPDRRRHDHVLPRLRLRLLLPALARQQRPLAPGRGRPADWLRDRDRRRASRSARRSSPTPRGRPGTAAAAGSPRRASRWYSGSSAASLQAFEYAHISFGPQSGGYASVFFGWTALYVVVVLIALYRVETIFAAGLAQPRRPGRTGAPARLRSRRLSTGRCWPGSACSPGSSSTWSERWSRHCTTPLGLDRGPGAALGPLRGAALLARRARAAPGRRRSLAHRRLRRRPAGDRRRARLPARRPRRPSSSGSTWSSTSC